MKIIELSDKAFDALALEFFPDSKAYFADWKSIHLWINGIPSHGNALHYDYMDTDKNALVEFQRKHTLSFTIGFDCHTENGVLVKDISAVLLRNAGQTLLSITQEG